MTLIGDIKYRFETSHKFMAIILPAIFLPFYYDANINIVFKILIYLAPALFLIIIDSNKMNIYDDTIHYTKFTSPFEKTFDLPMTDVEKVFISCVTLSYSASPTLTVYSKSLKKKFRVEIFRGAEQELCEFFIDKKVKVETNNNELDKLVLHSINDKKKK